MRAPKMLVAAVVAVARLASWDVLLVAKRRW